MNLKSQEYLDDAAVALESFNADLQHTLGQGRGNNQMELSIVARRWNILAEQFGFESIGGPGERDVWGMIKSAAAATTKRFGSMVESMQIYFDKSGGKEIDRLRRLVEQNRGDADGVVTNQSLATALNVNGKLPTDFAHEVTKLTGLVDLIEKAVPALAGLAKESIDAAPKVEAVADDGKVLDKYLNAIMHAALKLGSPLHLYPTAVLTEQFMGGLGLFVAKTNLPKPQKFGNVSLQKIVDIVSTLKYSFAPRKSKQAAINPRLPILGNHQLKDILELCEKLTDALHRLLALAKKHGSQDDCSVVAREMDYMFGELDKRKSVSHVGSNYQAGWLVEYYRSDVSNHRKLIEAGMHIVGSAHKALTEYVHASMKQYK